MPFSSSIVILELQELHSVQTAFPALAWPTTQNYRQHATPFMGLGGLNVNTPYVWRRNVTIEATFDAEYSFATVAQNGFDPAGTATVIEVYERLDKPASVTYVTTTTIATALGHLPADCLISDAFEFTASIAPPSPNGLSGSMRLEWAEIFGEAAVFEEHSYFQNGYGVEATSASLYAVAPPSIGSQASITANVHPQTKYRVKFKPIDLDGNQLVKPVILVFGDIYDTPGTIDGSTDFLDFIQEANTPVDDEFTVVKRCSALSALLRTSSSTFHTYSFDAPVKSWATNVSIYWRYAAFGETPGSYLYEEIANPLERNINHLFSDDSDSRDVEFATVQLSSTKDLTHAAWAAQGDGASAVGDNLTAGDATGTFTAVLSPIVSGSPYRYLAFDYDVADGSPNVSVEVVAASFGSPDVVKTFSAGILSGTGTAYIDTLRPSLIAGSPASSFPRLESYNQAQQVETTAASSRFSGLRSIYSVRLLFSDATVEVTDLRMAVKDIARLSHRAGSVDGASSELSHFMAGHVDGRDAFRVGNGSTLSGLVGLLNTKQSMTIVGTNYALPSHAPASSMELRPVRELDVQQPDFDLQPDQDATSVCELHGSLSSSAGYGAFYGRWELNWDDNEVIALHVWGNEAAATAVGGSATEVRITSPADPVFTYDYPVDSYGFGSQVLVNSRYERTVPHALDVEHFVPRHSSPQTKAYYDLVAIGRRYHVYVGGVSIGRAKLAYDVSASLRHYRAQIRDDGIVWFGVSDNSLDWDDIETGLEARSIALQVDKFRKGQRVYIWLETNDGDIVRHYTDDEGQTFSVATQISTSGEASMPAACIGRQGNHFVYWIDGGTDVKGVIFDNALNELEAEFTAIPGVDNDGLAVDESIEQGGVQRIVAFCIQSGDLFQYIGPSGRNFA